MVVGIDEAVVIHHDLVPGVQNCLAARLRLGADAAVHLIGNGGVEVERRKRVILHFPKRVSAGSHGLRLDRFGNVHSALPHFKRHHAAQVVFHVHKIYKRKKSALVGRDDNGAPVGNALYRGDGKFALCKQRARNGDADPAQTGRGDKHSSHCVAALDGCAPRQRHRTVRSTIVQLHRRQKMQAGRRQILAQHDTRVRRRNVEPFPLCIVAAGLTASRFKIPHIAAGRDRRIVLGHEHCVRRSASPM